MGKTVREVLGDPATWPNYREGGTRMPLLRGAKLIGAREVEPDELRIAIETRGQIMHPTFVIEDRDVRQRLLEILRPGLLLEDILTHPL